ncbi:MAG TPA: hypothetical protein VFK36_06805 [Gemmatimonadales bacterium]|nr:hypothetical protein [Gemmatimonadales bacterium]
MRTLALTTALALVAAPLAAQQRAQVKIAHATPEQAQAAIGEELAGQHFELREHNEKHAIFSASAGNRMETDGTQLTLRYELEFRMKPEKDSLSVWLQKETLVGETRDGQERRQERDPKDNRSTFQGVLNSVKARIEQPADSSGA